MKKFVNNIKDSVLPTPIKRCKAYSRKAFTLAEILISLVILGVIAALTIPTLIQNTQKKEEVVKIKKALSMLNQAIATNYALTGEGLSETDPNGIWDIIETRLSVVDNYEVALYTTSDGLGYSYNGPESADFDPEKYVTMVTIYTRPDNKRYGCTFGFETSECENNQYDVEEGSPGNLTGLYNVFCYTDRCVPSEKTAAILNASDPTKVESGS